VPDNAEWKRVFGAGYFQKRMGLPGIALERNIIAPRNSDKPLLLSVVTIENKSDRKREIDLIEYWDLNIDVIDDFLVGGGIMHNIRDNRVLLEESGGGLLARPKTAVNRKDPPEPALVYPGLPAVGLSMQGRAPDAWITDPGELFKDGAPLQKASLLRRAGEKDLRQGPLQQDEVCLAARVHVELEPFSSRTLGFVYSYVPAFEAESGRAPSYEGEVASAPAMHGKLWRGESPQLRLEKDRFLERELEWDYYYLTSSALFDGYYNKHHVPQGGNYLYYSGGDGATRDYAAVAMALTYYKPELAREILEYTMRSQEPSGRLFYDLEGYGKRYTVPYRPGDLDLWFLWALTEYVYATRDMAFLEQEVPYYPLGKAGSGPVWEHARRSLFHLVDEVGVGPHGHPRLRLSDWNDEMMWLTAGSNPLDMYMTYVRGESVMNTAMACHILPRFARLARLRGHPETAQKTEEFLEKMRKVLPEAWHEDHLIRSYSGTGDPYGKEEMYLEPQVWALLAGDVLGKERTDILLEAIQTKLREPSSLGMLISTSTSGSLTTRPGEQEEGGIWFAINGPGAVALSAYDRQAGWDELVKNTLARHAITCPEMWYGIWSGPDAWNSVFSERPGQTWYMKTPVMNTGPQMYPVQNVHAHCQTMWALARIAGIEPVAEGWTIDPRVPMENFSLTTALFSISRSPGRAEGECRAMAPLKLSVKLPSGVRPEDAKAYVNGTVVDAAHEKGAVGFMVRPGDAWSVHW
jgi:hypothetical protein